MNYKHLDHYVIYFNSLQIYENVELILFLFVAVPLDILAVLLIIFMLQF